MNEDIEAINQEIDSVWFRVYPSQYGKGCSAKTRIPSGQIVHSCRPLSSTIYAPYRKEVCFTCFNYEGGKTLKHRLGKKQFVYFCSETCLNQFQSQPGSEQYLQFLLDLEAHYVKSLKKYQEREFAADKNASDESRDEWERIDQWDKKVGQMKPSERLRSLPDIGETEYNEIKYVYGVLHQMTYGNSKEMHLLKYLQSNEDDKISKYPELLYAYNSIYKYIKLSTHGKLPSIVTTDFIRFIIGVSLCNSFGIWFESDINDVDKELFGFSLCPSASFFNHSCSPNVQKKRIGSEFVYTAVEDIEPGSDLYISYGNFGDEDLKTRQSTLSEWFFHCGCTKCAKETQS
ncbi:Piso0_001831 [Millerozyma farinosa CBS 7064]|uniref:Piso0_001831 protein n=1 Tax=Pichia sorbitophila (strain ATCC MYA-4447 / BCRC 22081 / CBS 7064 / NBRC 10061 / NRRL Y-12695) TaxID=559304 RepID=G8YLU9_PICSO|nr:Piso0_001831 [Millerozyma farinosa CBS 7064]